ncbi:hypothetical protein D3C87_1976160 [compost metagenome]
MNVLQPFELPIAIEVPGCVGIALQALEEIAKRCVDTGGKLLPGVTDAGTALVVEPGKTQALQQTACLALPCLF